MAEQKKKGSKGHDNRPARARYWAEGHLGKNKVRNLVKHNPVYDEPGICDGIFTCPQCHKRSRMDLIKKQGRGYCTKCKYKLKTRPLTEAQAKTMWHSIRKRHRAA